MCYYLNVQFQGRRVKPTYVYIENLLDRHKAKLFVKQKESVPLIIYSDTPVYTRSVF